MGAAMRAHGFEREARSESWDRLSVAVVLANEIVSLQKHHKDGRVTSTELVALVRAIWAVARERGVVFRTMANLHDLGGITPC